MDGEPFLHRARPNLLLFKSGLLACRIRGRERERQALRRRDDGQPLQAAGHVADNAASAGRDDLSDRAGARRLAKGPGRDSSRRQQRRVVAGRLDLLERRGSVALRHRVRKRRQDRRRPGAAGDAHRQTQSRERPDSRQRRFCTPTVSKWGSCVASISSATPVRGAATVRSIRMAPRERFGVVIAADRSGVTLNRTADKAMELLLPLQPAAHETDSAPKGMTSAEMADLAGTYSQSTRTMSIVQRDGRLFLARSNGETALEKVGANSFRAGDSRLVTVADAAGKVEYIAYRRAILEEGVVSNLADRSSACRLQRLFATRRQRVPRPVARARSASRASRPRRSPGPTSS